MKPVQEDNKFFVARRKHIYWEYAFWANVFWTLPAILYISADISFFVAPSNSTVGGYLRFVAAIATAIDWVFFMLDWNQGSDNEAVMRKSALREVAMDPIMTWLVQIDWYLHSNVTFLCATIAYMAQSVFDLYVPDVDGTIYFIVDIIGTHSWLMSSLQVLAGWYVNRLSQRRADTQVEYVLFTRSCWPLRQSNPMEMRRSPTVHLQVDWSGWGDWIFVMSSTIFVIQTYLNEYMYEVRRATLIDLVGCTCDLINSLLYLHAFLLFYRGYSTRLPENLAVDVIPLMETDNASSDSLSLLDPGLSGLSVV